MNQRTQSCRSIAIKASAFCRQDSFDVDFHYYLNTEAKLDFIYELGTCPKLDLPSDLYWTYPPEKA